MHRPDTCPTPLKSHKSQTSLVHHLTPFYLTVSRPGATDPRAKHQALAPCLPISLCHKSISVNVLLTFNASARACGQKRWRTTSNLRTYNAIWDTNIKPCPAPRSRVDVKVNFRQNKKLFDTCIGIFSSFTSVRTPSSVPLFILFPSHFNDSSFKEKMHRPDTCPTPLKSHKSQTSLVHHLTPFYFTVSRPGATDPRAKHQALAPCLPISFRLKKMFVTVLLVFNASASASGRKQCQTKPCQFRELTRRSATTT